MFKLLAFAMLCLLAPTAAFSDSASVRSSLSSYSDNQDYKHIKGKAEVGFDLDHENTVLTKTGYEFSLGQDNYVKPGDKYTQETYGSDRWTQDSVSLKLKQTWYKLTDTRISASYKKDEEAPIDYKTFGLGVSQWFWHESIQANFDFYRTLTSQPIYEFLDSDSELISLPENQNAMGTQIGLKHLATPTTITKYKLLHIERDTRPVENDYTFEIKQMIPKTGSAIQLEATRAINHGQITLETDYGAVDAWIFEAAFLQGLWKGGHGRFWYRMYKENEVTRALQDEYQRASDTFGLNLSQSMGLLANNLFLDASYAKYLTNALHNGEKVKADYFELGLKKVL